MQLCNWKLLFWSCHQSFTSLMHPALIDNYLMMISRSTSKAYKQGPQLAFLNYSSLPPHLCVIVHTLFILAKVNIFVLCLDFKICAEVEGRGRRVYVSMPLPSAISLFQCHIFISEISHSFFFFNELIGIAAAKLLVPQHQILWMTQKEF